MKIAFMRFQEIEAVSIKRYFKIPVHNLEVTELRS